MKSLKLIALGAALFLAPLPSLADDASIWIVQTDYVINGSPAFDLDMVGGIDGHR